MITLHECVQSYKRCMCNLCNSSSKLSVAIIRYIIGSAKVVRPQNVSVELKKTLKSNKKTKTEKGCEIKVDDLHDSINVPMNVMK